MSASAGLRQALSERVVVADGAMGTMLQAANLTIDDFDGHEGCNEILNVTRPDVVRSVHDAYFAVGVDCVETNTFGANWANLGEYGIADRIGSAVRSRRSAGPAGCRRMVHAGPPSVGTGLGRSGDEAALARPRPVRRVARRVPHAGRRDDRRRRRRGLGGDRAGSFAGESRGHRSPSGHEGGRCRPPATGQRDRRDDRDDAARHRDRRCAGRARAAAGRLRRPELRDRTGGDERAPASPGPTRTNRPGLHAQRGTAGAHRRRCPLPADSPPAGRRPRPVHRRVRVGTGGRLLRHHTGAPSTGSRAGAREGGHRSQAPHRAGHQQPLPARPVPPGHVLPRHRRADERQWLKGLPRGDARAAVRRLRRDRAVADPRRVAPARPVRRLRRPGRRGGHARRSRAGSRRPARCRSCSTQPSPLLSSPGWSAWADEVSSTRSTTRMATDRSRGLPGRPGSRWSTARR